MLFRIYPLQLMTGRIFVNLPLFKEGTTFTAFSDNQVIGSVTVYWDLTQKIRSSKIAGFTEYIFVNEAWRRQGIASYLITRGLEYLKEHCVQEALLDVDTK